MMYDERTVIDPIARVEQLEAKIKMMESEFACEMEKAEHRYRKAEEDSRYWQMRCDEIDKELMMRKAQVAIVQMIFTGEAYEI